MCARRARSGVPVKLLGNRIVFTNWAFVYQGHSTWRNARGESVGVTGSEGPEDAYLDPGAANPRGIRILQHPAQPTGPLLHLEAPWERDGAIGTLLEVDGTYRAWLATGWGDLQIASPGARPQDFICYMESGDGFTWSRPSCNQFEFDGSKENNIVYRTPCFIGGGLSVFRDPSAGDGERYKLVAEWPTWDLEALERYRARWRDHVDPRAFREDAGLLMGIQGATSPDGIQWTVLPEPLTVTHCDTQLVGCYNQHLGQYVVYTRDYVDLPAAEGPSYNVARMVRAARRAVGAARSECFRHFPLPEVVLQGDAEMRPSEVLYTNAYTTVPGAPEHHLLFPAVWDLCRNDETWIRSASSHDGLLWQWIPGEPLFKTGAWGQWNGGCVFAHPNLTELPNGDWALPFTGFNVPHKYPRVKARRNTGYALWPGGRFVSLRAEEKGTFQTIAVIPPGGSLHINALTRRAGHIRVEALDREGRALRGRSLQDCVPLVGDLSWSPVRWRGTESLGIGDGEEVTLRFEMDQGEIFGLEFR